MSSTLTRVYGDHERASAAVAALKKSGFRDSSINVISEAEGSRDGLVAAIVNAGVRRSHAMQYAEELAGGRVLVVVRAPFGESSVASWALDQAGPIASKVGEQDVYKSDPEDFLLSSMLGLPLLSKSESTVRLLDGRSSTKVGDWTFSKVGDSTFSGLIQGTISSRLGIPELIKKK